MTRPLHTIAELSSLARAFGGAAVVVGTRVVRCMRDGQHAEQLVWSVDGQVQSEAYVSVLMSRDWTDTTSAEDTMTE
jgi:hypothetical protein